MVWWSLWIHFAAERERERERERDVAVCGGEVKKMKNKKIRKERMSGWGKSYKKKKKRKKKEKL